MCALRNKTSPARDHPAAGARLIFGSCGGEHNRFGAHPGACEHGGRRILSTVGSIASTWENRLRVSSLLLLLVLMVAAAPATAHHSPAMFDMGKRVQLKGMVREFQWTNPHSYIQLLVKDRSGKDVEWSLEMAAPTYLYNNGWRPSTLEKGDAIIVTMAPLASGAHGGLIISVTTADGRKLGGGSKP